MLPVNIGCLDLLRQGSGGPKKNDDGTFVKNASLLAHIQLSGEE